jgi:hypothetical protein
MKKNNNKGSSAILGGTAFSALLTILFTLLKISKIIKWSWLWVLSPLWIPSVIFIVLLILFIIIGIFTDK